MSIPSLGDWGVQLGDLAMGPGTPYELVVLTGLDELPEIRSSDVPRTFAHGEFPGDDFASGITVNVTLEVAGDTYRESLAALRAVLIPGIVMPLWFRLPGLPVLHIDAKVRRRRIPTDLAFEAGLATVEFQLHAADAFKYGATVTASTGFAVPAIGAGMVWPAFPGGVMDFGPLGDVGTLSLANAGTAPAPVVFTITGPAPAEGFTIVDLSTAKRITYMGSLPAGSSLVMDGSDGSVTINGTADRLGDTIREAWPMIPAGGEVTFSFEPIGAPTSALLSAQCTYTYW